MIMLWSIAMPWPVAMVLWTLLVAPGAQGSDPGLCKKLSNGCSVPEGAPHICESLFTPACDRHDSCYQCGSYFGVTRDQCDEAFREDLLQLCTPDVDDSCTRRVRRSPNLLEWAAGELVHLAEAATDSTCHKVASLYYSAVHTFGEDFYRETNDTAHCDESIKTCVPEQKHD